jgi:two-component system cell cycle response regulator DivK
VKALIVEDNEFNQIVLQDMLQILFPQLEVTLHNSAVESLEIGGHQQYDIIFSDIDMPGIDGFEFYTKLREECQVGMPILAITALAVSGDKEKILMHGFDAYISKPIDLDNLKEVVTPIVEA